MYQLSKGRVNPFFSCHLFLLSCLHPAGEHNQSLTPRQGEQISDGSVKKLSTEFNIRNVELSREAEWHYYWDWGTEETGLWTWWTFPQRLIPVNPTSYHGVPEKCAPRTVSSSFFNVTSVGGIERLCAWLSLEARDVLPNKPPARKLEKYDVLGS